MNQPKAGRVQPNHFSVGEVFNISSWRGSIQHRIAARQECTLAVNSDLRSIQHRIAALLKERLAVNSSFFGVGSWLN